MFNYQKPYRIFFCIFLITFCSAPLWALEVLDQNYIAETYTTFNTPEVRPPEYMKFAEGQNLYVAYYNTADAHDGKIYHIDPDKNVTVIASGLSRSWGITWTGGTDYGDYLYITEGWAVSVPLISTAGRLTRKTPPVAANSKVPTIKATRKRRRSFSFPQFAFDMRTIK